MFTYVNMKPNSMLLTDICKFIYRIKRTHNSRATGCHHEKWNIILRKEYNLFLKYINTA